MVITFVLTHYQCVQLQNGEAPIRLLQQQLTAAAGQHQKEMKDARKAAKEVQRVQAQDMALHQQQLLPKETAALQVHVKVLGIGYV